MKPFHLIVRGDPNVFLERTRVTVDGVELNSLCVPPELRAVPLAVSFDDVADRLESFSRLHFEPDGSFVWVSENNSPAWQVDGNLYDRGDSLSHVEVKGTCSAAEWSRLLSTLRSDCAQLLFELVPAAVFIDEAELMRLLGEAQDQSS